MQKYTAIILSSRDTNEFDRIYTMYTAEKGLVRAVGKGVRKAAARLAGHLEPATISEVYIARSRGMGQITSAITIDSHEEIKKNFQNLSEVLKIFRFIEKKFSEEEEDERIFYLLGIFLNLVSQKTSSQSLALGVLMEGFWWKLIDFLGKRPEVIRCTVCQNKLTENSKKYFSFEKGGVVCGACQKEQGSIFSISNNQIKMLRIFWGNELEKSLKVKIAPEELRQLEKIRKLFLEYSF